MMMIEIQCVSIGLWASSLILFATVLDSISLESNTNQAHILDDEFNALHSSSFQQISCITKVSHGIFGSEADIDNAEFAVDSRIAEVQGADTITTWEIWGSIEPPNNFHKQIVDWACIMLDGSFDFEFTPD